MQNQIPKNWQKVKLGELLEGVVDNRGKTPPLSQSGFPMIEVYQLSRDSKYPNVNYDSKQKYVSESTYNSWFRAGHPEPGDILVSTVGTISQWNLVPENQRYCIAQNVVALKPDPEKTSAEFLRHYFNQRKFIGQVQGIAIGAAQPSVRLPHFLNLEIDIPEKKIEQNNIASFLSAFDDKIEVNNKIAKTLEEMAQMIFKEWFNREKHQLKTQKIRDLGKVTTGKTPSTKDLLNFGSDYPFVTIPDMANVFVLKTERYLSQKSADRMRNLLLPAGSVCVSCIATVGLVSITTEKSITNQQINSVIPHNPEYTYFLYLFFKRNKSLLEAFGAGGSTTLIINKSQFENLDIQSPDNLTMKKFHQLVEPMYKKILTISKENLKLATMRNLLLPKLMRGEIRV